MRIVLSRPTRCLILALVPLAGCLAQIEIPEGTKVQVKLERRLTSSTAREGQPVELSVAEEVKINGQVVIARGAAASGYVLSAAPKGRMNKAGKLDFSIDKVTTVDGQKIPVRSDARKPETAAGGEKKGGIIGGAASVGSAPLKIFKKGSDQSFDRGALFDVFTDGKCLLHPPDDKAPAEKGVVVTVTSEPSGADVEVDGAFSGSTPSTLDLTPGEHSVTVKRGQRVWSRKLVVRAGNKLTVNAVLADEPATPVPAPISAAPLPATEPDAAPPANNAARIDTVHDIKEVAAEEVKPTVVAPPPNPAPNVVPALPTTGALSYVIQAQPWRVAIFDREKDRIVKSIPLAEKPDQLLSDGSFLYVTHLQNANRTKQRVLMDIIDIRRGMRTRTISLGLFPPLLFGLVSYDMKFERDGKEIVVSGLQRELVVDTSTQEATERQKVEKRSVIRGSDLSVSFSPARDAKGKRYISQAMWFSDGNSGQKRDTVDLGGRLVDWGPSRDGKRLFVLVKKISRNGKELLKEGELKTYEMGSGKLIQTSPALDQPLWLQFFPGSDGVWVASLASLQHVDEDGTLTDLKIPATTEGRMGRSCFPIGKQRYVVALFENNGNPAHKVALLDIQAGKMEKVIPVGRASVRRAKAAKGFLKALAINAAIGAAGGLASAGTGTWVDTPVYLPGGALYTEMMLLDQGEHNLYILESESDDVTVLSTADGSVTATIPVEGKATRLWRPPGGDLIYCLGENHLQVIDTRTNQPPREIVSKFRSRVLVDSKRGELLLLSDNGVEILDALNGERKVFVADLDHPKSFHSTYDVATVE